MFEIYHVVLINEVYFYEHFFVSILSETPSRATITAIMTSIVENHMTEIPQSPTLMAPPLWGLRYAVEVHLFTTKN